MAHGLWDTGSAVVGQGPSPVAYVVQNWVGWHHWISAHESEQTQGDNEESQLCWSSQGAARVGHDLAAEQQQQMWNLPAPGIQPVFLHCRADSYHWITREVPWSIIFCIWVKSLFQVAYILYLMRKHGFMQLLGCFYYSSDWYYLENGAQKKSCVKITWFYFMISTSSLLNFSLLWNIGNLTLANSSGGVLNADTFASLAYTVSFTSKDADFFWLDPLSDRHSICVLTLLMRRALVDGAVYHH